jgi:nicotinate phosphoribosyltransferase
MKIFDENKPIISSLLETDTYKIRMLYFIWKFFPNLKTQFAFKNRTSTVKLAKEIGVDKIRQELDFVQQTLKFEESDIEFLREGEKYPEEFLKFLQDLRLSDIAVSEILQSTLDIKTAEDYWTNTTLCELIVLPIGNELYFREVIKQNNISEVDIIREGEKRLKEKAQILSGSGVRALQFGLRRRLSGAWEKHMTEMALDLMPDVMVAVSNMKLARELGVAYGGTNAHELSMALNALRWHEGPMNAYQSQYEVFEKWFELFSQDYRIILPDTFGSKQFLDNIPEELAYSSKGFRQDSGNPIEFGYWVIEMYQRFGINPREKTLFFSDGLNPAKMLKLQKEFGNKINVLFGWGTNFSNDVGFIDPISIVMKLIKATGNDAVKLSDNLAKAIGQIYAIERNKLLFGYNVTLDEKCVY